jgi:hypothetical protein
MYLRRDGGQTKAFVLSIIPDEIGTFGGLLCHECKDLFLRLDSLEELRFVNECIDIIHGLDKVTNTVIAVLLLDDNL